MTIRFSQKAVERVACHWFQRVSKAILASLDDPMAREAGFTIYLDKTGKLRTTRLVFGGVAEVNVLNAPPGCYEVGSLHTHTGCSAELSWADAEQGQKMANYTGLPYFVFVVGLSNDADKGIVMTQELFYPDKEDPEIMLARRLEV